MAGRPLLDSTAVLFGSGMGMQAHTPAEIFLFFLLEAVSDMGITIALNVTNVTDALGDLFVSILQQLEIEQDQFSNHGGNLNHLLT